MIFTTVYRNLAVITLGNSVPGTMFFLIKKLITFGYFFAFVKNFGLTAVTETSYLVFF